MNYRCFSTELKPIIAFTEDANERLHSFTISMVSQGSAFQFNFSGDFLMDEIHEIFNHIKATGLMFQSLTIMEKAPEKG